MVQGLGFQDSNPGYFQVQDFALDGAGRVFHGFFGRQGGVSSDIYASLNCGRGSYDVDERVRHNLHSVAGVVGVTASHLQTLYQVHSADCVYVEKPWAWEERPKADAFLEAAKPPDPPPITARS